MEEETFYIIVFVIAIILLGVGADSLTYLAKNPINSYYLVSRLAALSNKNQHIHGKAIAIVLYQQ